MRKAIEILVILKHIQFSASIEGHNTCQSTLPHFLPTKGSIKQKTNAQSLHCKWIKSADIPWLLWSWYCIQTMQGRLSNNSSPLEASHWMRASVKASKILEDRVWITLHGDDMHLKQNYPEANERKVSIEFLKAHLTLREKYVLPAAFPADV